MEIENIDVLKLFKEIEELRKENLKLKNENEKLKETLKKNNTIAINEKAKEAIQRKKTEKIKIYKRKIAEIIKERKDVNTKELINILEINNKTFYNLKLNEFFNNGEGI